VAEDRAAASLAVALRTLGCKVNRAESEAIATELLGAGARIVSDDEAAVIVVNTCTVTGEADAKARKAVRQALAAAREPVVVVTGCLAALDREALTALGRRVVVEADKERVASVVCRLLGEVGAPASESGAPAVNPAQPAPFAPGAFRTRVALKIEDGCDAMCAYCIVPHARGVPRSTPLATVSAQAQALADAGTQEIVLTGVNVGRYADGGADLADVVEAVAATGISRVRLSSIEPLDLTARLLETLSAIPAFCVHLHIPLQAGCDAVLSAMGRTYAAEQFAERVQAAREVLPGLVVTTDVMAGFPGETAEQAAETLAFCERAGFAKLHVFRYSRRPGTPAAQRPDQVADTQKAARASALRELSARLTRRHAASRIGAAAEVLVERVDRGADAAAFAEGTTRDYLRVRFPGREACVGELVGVRLLAVDADRVLGERLA
jgi:threonylcarbamoyladenosine tRNA methylthiotransferase MtaB